MMSINQKKKRVLKLSHPTYSPGLILFYGEKSAVDVLERDLTVTF